MLRAMAVSSIELKYLFSVFNLPELKPIEHSKNKVIARPVDCSKTRSHLEYSGLVQVSLKEEIVKINAFKG